MFYDKLKFIYIELPKFKKQLSELETHFDKWLYVFKHLPNLEERPMALKEKVFERLFEAAELAKFNKKDREAYEGSLKHFRDMNNVVNTAKEEGIIEGIKQGVQQKSQEIATALIEKGMTNKEISELTGLQERAIQTLRV